jgi:hypothetical protein
LHSGFSCGWFGCVGVGDGDRDISTKVYMRGYRVNIVNSGEISGFIGGYS